MWVFDLETLRFLDVNETAIRTYGYSRREFLDMTIEDLRPVADVPRLRETLRTLKPTDRHFGIWRHKKKDGTLFDVEVLSTEVTVRDRRARLGLVHDVTDRVRAERHRATEMAVTRVLIETKSFADAASRALAAICEAEDWILGEVWVHDPATSALRLDASWRAPGLPVTPGLEGATAKGRLEPGVGLVGRVWAREAPLWIRDLAEEAGQEWADLRVRSGLRSGVGFPIRTRSGREAVAVLFDRTVREPDDPLLDLLADIGSRIGQVLERERAEAARRNAVEAFQRAFQASPVPMAISGLRDGRFVEANPQFLRLFGYDRGEVLGRTSVDLRMWADDERRKILSDHLRERGAIRDAEVEMRTKSGEAKQTLLSIEHLDLRDQPAVLTTLVDVTELVAAREAQRRLAAIVQGSQDAIVGLSFDGKITTWNAGAATIYGYPNAEAIGQAATLLVPDDRRPEWDAILQQVRLGEPIAPFETIRLRKDGRKIVVSLSVSPIRDGAGHLVGLSAISRDITERRRSDRLVRRSEARYRQLFEVAADAILLIDRRGTILEANPAAASLLGRKDPSALRGINLGEIVPARELERARDYLRNLLRDRPVVEPFETYVELADGERHFVHVRSGVIREEGTDPYVQVVARDVTPEKEYQRGLLEAERGASMSQVAAFVAHEINTPLTNIALLTSSLGRGLQDPPFREKLAKIDSQRRFAADIVAQLVSLTRSQDLKRIPVDVRGVVAAAIDQADPVRKEPVRLTRDLPEEPLLAAVDPLRLQAALVNLLRNAFQATATGSVTVRLAAHDDRLTIVVADTGTGLDEEIRTRLFQPFVTTKPRPEGLGLGLVFAKQVIQAHDGSIDVTSEPRSGTTVTVTLPIGMDASAPAAPPESAAGTPKAP